MAQKAQTGTYKKKTWWSEFVVGEKQTGQVMLLHLGSCL